MLSSGVKRKHAQQWHIECLRSCRQVLFHLGYFCDAVECTPREGMQVCQGRVPV